MKETLLMKLSIGKLNVVGHRPNSAHHDADGNPRNLTVPERIKDALPIKWREKHAVELELAVWIKQAPRAERFYCRQIADDVKAMLASGSTVFIFRRAQSIHTTSLPPLPSTLTELTMDGGARARAATPSHEHAQHSTPPDFSRYPALQKVRIEGFFYLATAPDFSGCPALTSIDIEACNRLLTTPNVVGCSALKTFKMTSCMSLSTVTDFSSCSALTDVDLSHVGYMYDATEDEMLAVPDLSGNPALVSLDMRGRPLARLPEHIFALPQECDVLLTADHLPDTTRHRLAARMSGSHYAGPRIQFYDRDGVPVAIHPAAPMLSLSPATGAMVSGGRQSTNVVPASRHTTPHLMSRQTRLLLQAWRENASGETDEAIQRLNHMIMRGDHTLNWSGLNLSSLPDCFGQFRFIEQLDLGRNALATLPAQIGELASLTHLDARNNRLRSLPDSITQLQRLQRLNLEGNRLTELPRDLHRLTALRELRLCDNQIVTADQRFAGMTALLELNLERNPIRLTPADLDQLEPTTLIHAQNACVTAEDRAVMTGSRPSPCLYVSSELASLLYSHSTDRTTDPIALLEPQRRIQLLLESASHLQSRMESDVQRIDLGNRQLTRKDCLLMALETALEHHHALIPVISHRLIHDLPDDTDRFALFGSHLKRERITEWANRQNLPVTTLVDEVAANVGQQMRTTDSQNVHAPVVLIAGARVLERLRQQVTTPLSHAQTRAEIAAYLQAAGAPAGVLLGLDRVMNRTLVLADFATSAATAMALLWTYINQTTEQPLRDNLLNAMQNRLSEITPFICAVGTIQRVIDIPNGVDFSLTGAISMNELGDEMRQLAAEVNKEFDLLYGVVPEPETTAQELDLSPEKLMTNLAKTPTDLATTKKLLVRAIESGSGLIEFVSQRAQTRSEKSSANPIIKRLLDSPEYVVGKIQLNHRYAIDSIDQIDQSDAPEDRDHQSVQLTVRDRYTDAQRRIPLTQVGLKFSDRVLRSAAIQRADALLDQHLAQCADFAHSGQLPLMVTAGGNGRNLLLRAYREIRQGIRDDVVRNVADLDATLTRLAEISQQLRGKKHGFTDEQIAELKTLLLREFAPREFARQEQIDVEASAIKRELFKQKAHLELVLLRGLDANLVATETERVFPVGMVL
ncbi:MAG: Leucine-rich repeat (LRR) protein [Burkholderiaceae bacterium]